MRNIPLALFIAMLCLPLTPLEARRSYYETYADKLDGDPVDKIPIPVLFGISVNDINPDFGDPRGDGTRSHEGEDFIAPLGTPIVSPTEAIVTSVGFGSSAGNYVYTINPGGERFRYMHLDETADLERGDELNPGDFIGTVGDTGNAPEGVYHLHFETRGDDNDPQDPNERLVDGFTLEEKMEFLDGVFADISGDSDYAEFLVTTFPNEFRTALQEDYDLPRAIERALEDSDMVKQVELYEKLMKVIAMIPPLLAQELEVGDQSTQVSLLQTYLIFNSEGVARNQLVAATATGYYGSVTAAAISEYQRNNNLEETGVYDAETRAHMMQA